MNGVHQVMALLTGLTVFALGTLFRTEAGTRLERLPLLILRLAARRLPLVMRASQLEEWCANVIDEIHPTSLGLPLTRLVRGCTFALSAWYGARRLAREVEPSAPRNLAVACLVRGWQFSARAGWAADRRGYPRLLCHMIVYGTIGSLFLMPPWLLMSWLAHADMQLLPRLALSVGTVLITVSLLAICQGILASILEQAACQGWTTYRRQYGLLLADRTANSVALGLILVLIYPSLLTISALASGVVIALACDLILLRLLDRRWKRAGVVPVIPTPLLAQVAPLRRVGG